MCGIFGAADFKGFFAESDYSRFVSLTDLVSYRGPDASGYSTLALKGDANFASRRFDVFLGHRRLSIIDLSSAGHQPMDDNRGHSICYNGEIFNFVELRQELEAIGYRFRTQTDTEVILHLYDKYGCSGFARLNGMWAFALVDRANRRLVLSRDRFSMKPLYLLNGGSQLFWASEIKQLLPLLPARDINHDAMAAYLAQGLLDHNSDTFFRGITKVPPKCSMVISMDDGTISEQRYWDFEPARESVPINQAVERFREYFIDSVRIRLRSDVKVGCLLSGGLDSSTISLVASQLSQGNLETYSVVSEDPKYSEEPFIDALTHSAHLRNHKIVFRPSDVLDTLTTALYHGDEPFGGLNAVAQYKMFEAIRRHTDVTVLLSGQGGDEVLLGYLKFFFLNLKGLLRHHKYLRAASQFMGSLIRGTAVRQFRLSEARRYVPSLAQRAFGGALRRRYSFSPIWQDGDIRLRQIADIDLYSIPPLAHLEDRNAMAHSLEVRHPFLDHRLLNFAVNLPTDLKLNGGWAKYILRKAFPELPDCIRWRRDKQGFLTPEELWLRHDLRGHILRSFEGSTLQELGVLDDKKFLAHYQQFLAGKPVFYGDISRAFIAETWAQKFFASSMANLEMPGIPSLLDS